MQSRCVSSILVICLHRLHATVCDQYQYRLYKAPPYFQNSLFVQSTGWSNCQTGRRSAPPCRQLLVSKRGHTPVLTSTELSETELMNDVWIDTHFLFLTVFLCQKTGRWSSCVHLGRNESRLLSFVFEKDTKRGLRCESCFNGRSG